MMTLKKIFRSKLLYVLYMFFFASQVFAQVPSSIPNGIDPNNLKNVKVDELTDNQILQIFNQGQNSGFTIEQTEQMAAKRGLPSSEIQKLKDRLSKLKTGPEKILQSEKNNEDKIDEKNKVNEIKADSLTGSLVNTKKVKVTKSKTYGHEFFREETIRNFEHSVDSKAPDNYVIGINDELGVSVFGYSYYNEILKVDSKGAINPNQMGPIYVKGLTFEKTKALIRSKVSQYFDLNNNKLEVTLAYSRSITVNIVGEVFSPGSYKMPALNTAFNALIMAGGPTDIGTLRNIEIRRAGKKISSLDVYAFLNNPDFKNNYFLEDNDYIVVGTFKKGVTISGEVKRASDYELLDKENLFDLLKYAGGLKSNAYKEKIQIRRVTSNESLIIDVNLDSLINNKKDFPLMNGDIVNVRSAINEALTITSVVGAVNFPGEYGLKKGEKVLDLISKAGGLKVDSKLDDAYIIRTLPSQEKKYILINIQNLLESPNSDQNILLEPKDELIIYSNKAFVNEFSVKIYGAVKNANEYKYVNGMTMLDLIKQANGFSVDAENLRIEISRLNYFSSNYQDGQDIRVIVERITLPNTLLGSDSREALIQLQPFDEVFVRSIPNFGPQNNITLRGEVKYPGVYSLLSKDEKLSSVIKRAGGLTKYAFPEAATFFRPELPEGYIVLKMQRVVKTEYSKYNYTLQAGDVITIPTVNDFVSIRGSSIEYLSIVNKQQINAPFVKNRRAGYYIRNFGNGFSKESLKRKTYVIQPNAKVNRTYNFILFRVYPKVTKGSTIYVVSKQEKKKKTNEEKVPVDWNKFIESSLVKLTGIATLFILFKQL